MSREYAATSADSVSSLLLSWLELFGDRCHPAWWVAVATLLPLKPRSFLLLKQQHEVVETSVCVAAVCVAAVCVAAVCVAAVCEAAVCVAAVCVAAPSRFVNKQGGGKLLFYGSALVLPVQEYRNEIIYSTDP